MSTCLVLGLSVSGCMRREGDLGRPKPGFLNDRIMPEAGYWASRSRKDPVSRYDLTQDEILLRDTSWRYVVPPHGKDWLGRTASELQRTQLVHRLDLKAAPERYNALLHSQRYADPHVRYARLSEDALIDAEGVGQFYALADAVKAADGARVAHAQALPDIRPEEIADVYGRVAENERYVAWVERAFWFRLYAYRYALDRLGLSAPSHDFHQVRHHLDVLEDTLRLRGQDPGISFDDTVDLMAIIRKG